MATTLTLILAAGGGFLLLAWVLGDGWRGVKASSTDGGGPDRFDGDAGGETATAEGMAAAAATEEQREFWALFSRSGKVFEVAWRSSSCSPPSI